MTSLRHFLDEVARRGSWMGGGSAAAFTAALAAALLEKLARSPADRRQFRHMRMACVAAIDADAKAFARVITAMRARRRAQVARALRRATEVPCGVSERAGTLSRRARQMARRMPPRLRADARCAMAMSVAAGEAARALVRANLQWLGDRAYAARVKRRLARALRGETSRRRAA